MTQVEALRLAMRKTPLEKLKPVDVLTHGFYQIKNFDTGAGLEPIRQGGKPFRRDQMATRA